MKFRPDRSDSSGEDGIHYWYVLIGQDGIPIYRPFHLDRPGWKNSILTDQVGIRFCLDCLKQNGQLDHDALTGQVKMEFHLDLPGWTEMSRRPVKAEYQPAPFYLDWSRRKPLGHDQSSQQAHLNHPASTNRTHFCSNMSKWETNLDRPIVTDQNGKPISTTPPERGKSALSILTGQDGPSIWKIPS